MRASSFPFSLLMLATVALVWSCSSPDGGGPAGAASGGSQSTGGATGSGGTVASGGSTAAGGNTGTTSSGGTASSGGTKGTGGATMTGGSVSTGGRSATGGVSATGGIPATGGVSATGGRSATGGTVASGGTVAAGGNSANGGTNSTGGTRPSGGSTGSGGSGGGPSIDAGATTKTIPGKECTPPAAYANLFVSLSGHTQAESDAKVAAAWSKLFNPSGSTIYFNGPGSDESYVKDNYNNDVRTEGMGYGMVIAVQLDHQTEFDRIWKWVKTHMAQGTTGEIRWQCQTSGSGCAGGGAPDGEEYMATGLIFAHTRWGDTSGKYNYATEAKWVLDVIRTKYFNTQYHLVKFVAGSNNTDASYVLPAFYQVWACFDTANKAFWDASVTAAREFFHVAIDANGVIPDQSSWTGGTVKGATVDWIRCVANIMMDWNFFAVDTWQTDTYATKFGAHEKNVGAGAQGFCDSLLGFGLPASSGKAFVDRIWSAGIPTGYWDGTLYMLALLHVSGTFHLWY
jgi:oligosaccharide reducing-end xylanase